MGSRICLIKDLSPEQVARKKRREAMRHRKSTGTKKKLVSVAQMVFFCAFVLIGEILMFKYGYIG